MLVISGLASLTLAYFWRVIFTGQALFWGDLLLAFYPAHALWRQSLLRGDLPLWNPYIFAGMPLLADAQYATFYPSMVLQLFLPLHRALAVDLGLHVFMLAAFTYVFLRRLALSAASAFLGAVIFAFSGFVAVRVHHVSLIRTLAWLPLLLYVVAGFSLRRDTIRTALAVGAILAAMVLAGHMQTVLISGLIAVAFALWGLRSVRRTGGAGTDSAFVPLVAALALGALLAVAVAAAQVLPAVELVRQSERSGGTDYQFATSFSLPLRQLPMLFSPGLFGIPTRGIYWGEWLYWEMVGYAGIVPIMLALVGLLFSGRRDRAFWLLIGLAGVGLAVGNALPLYPIAYWVVPGIAYFRVPARFLVWYTFAVAVLAAAGLDWLRQSPPRPRLWLGFIAGAGVVAAAAGYWAAGGSTLLAVVRWLADGAVRSAAFFPPALKQTALDTVGEVAIREGRRFALLWVSAGILIGVGVLRRGAISFATPLLLLLTVLDLFSFGMNFYPPTAAANLYGETTSTRILDLRSPAHRMLTSPQFGSSVWLGTMTFRTGVDSPEALARFRDTLLPNTNVLHGVANVAGYSPLVVRSAQQFLALAIGQAAQNGGRSPLLDFLGARYIFSPASLAPPLRRVDGVPFNVWRNDGALPRGYLVTRYVVEPDEERRWRLLTEGIDLTRVVILDRPPEVDFGLRQVETPGRILRRSYGLTTVSFDLQLAHPAILVLSDTYYPGWRVYVDGRRQPLFRANHAFRAVFLPAGAKRVAFVYEPGSVRLGLAISGCSWLTVALVWLAGLRKRAGRARQWRSGRPG